VKIEYTYRHAPTILAFSESDSFIRGLMGPFGSGKSTGCVIEIIRRGHEQKPGIDGIRRTRWAVVRNTYPQLNDTTIKTFMDWIPETVFGRYNKAEHVYTITGFPGVHIEILFRALDKPQHVKNLLSLELTGAWFNEAREIPWEIIKPMIGRVSRYPAPKDGGATWYGIICDTNPPDNDSWWFNLFETDTFTVLAKRWESKTNRVFQEVFKQPGGLSDKAENTQFLVNGYYDALAADPDEGWVKVHVHGEYGFIRTGKPVYETYKDSLHCRSTPVISGLKIYRAWDYGLTPACVLHQITPSGQLRAIDEVVATRAGISDFTDEVLKHCAVNYPMYEFEDVGDPAGNTTIDIEKSNEKSCFSIQRAKGVDIQPGKQALELRLESVRYGLNTLIDGNPAIVVDPKCKVLRKGFQGGYKYRRILTSGEAKYQDKPDKDKHSHAHDAHQYQAAELFGDIIQGMDKFKQIPQTQIYDDSDPWGDDVAWGN